MISCHWYLWEPILKLVINFLKPAQHKQSRNNNVIDNVITAPPSTTTTLKTTTLTTTKTAELQKQKRELQQ